MDKKLATPKEFDTYIRVVNPSFWIVLIAAVSIIIGGTIWAFTAEMAMTMTVYAVAGEESLIAFIDSEEAENITLDSQVTSDFGTITISQKSEKPISYQECTESISDDYSLELVSPSTWNTVLELSTDFDVEEGAIYEVTIVTEEISPFELIFY